MNNNEEYGILKVLVTDRVRRMMKEIEILKTDTHELFKVLQGEHEVLLTFDKSFADDWSAEFKRHYSKLQAMYDGLEKFIYESYKEENIDWVMNF